MKASIHEWWWAGSIGDVDKLTKSWSWDNLSPFVQNEGRREAVYLGYWHGTYEC